MKKLILTFITITILTLTSCAGSNDTQPTTNNGNQSSSSSQSTTETVVEIAETSNEFAPFPRTIENHKGELVTLEEKPTTVASMVFGTDEILLDLTELDNIIGLSGKDNGVLYKSDPQNLSSDIPKINDNAEILTSLYPDAIIGASWVSADLQDVMADMDIPFYGYTTPKTMEEQIKIIQDIGYFLGEDDKANAIVDDLNGRLQTVIDTTSNLQEEEKARVMAYNIHGSTSSKGTMFDSMVNSANVINVSTEAGLEGTAEISKEQLVELNPEVIILVKWAQDTTEEFYSFLEEFMSDESLSTISAIENDRVYSSLDNSITNVSHFAIDGLEFIAQSCYPELFE